MAAAGASGRSKPCGSADRPLTRDRPSFARSTRKSSVKEAEKPQKTGPPLAEPTQHEEHTRNLSNGTHHPRDRKTDLHPDCTPQSKSQKAISAESVAGHRTNRPARNRSLPHTLRLQRQHSPHRDASPRQSARRGSSGNSCRENRLAASIQPSQVPNDSSRAGQKNRDGSLSNQRDRARQKKCSPIHPHAAATGNTPRGVRPISRSLNQDGSRSNLKRILKLFFKPRTPTQTGWVLLKLGYLRKKFLQLNHHFRRKTAG